ncbi:MFS transporter [Nocardia sp. NPDC003482]|jgi:EmrB/QacA subfamily drug resistance transporter|uniref:Antiseptic resistance protein n=2 Tax=Nocardia TaxID=1817 RepID=A0A231GVG7_9NOCA|nr:MULTISPECIES: MFS transporter [Nocardia]OXR40619.1 Antiseptic resistance protein [Nocardia cerradoensis]
MQRKNKMISFGDLSAIRRSAAWTLVVTCAAVALVVAAMAALYTALPAVALDTGADQGALTWMVDGYTLVLACLVLPGGAIGDRYGRRRVLTIGLAVFAAASAIPLIVDNPAWLIASRAVAGAGAAFVMPATLSILTASLPDARRAHAVSVWAGVAGSGGVIGMVGSGLLLIRWSWHSIFLGMTAVALTLLAFAFTVPESQDSDRPRLEIRGMFWVVLSIGTAVFAVMEAPSRGWTDTRVLILGGCGVLSIVAFILTELRAENPLLDVRLFRRRGFASGALSITIQFLVTFGVMFLLVQHFQLILGFGPLKSAVALAPMVVPLVAMSLVSPTIAARVGLRMTTAAGLLTIAIGLVALLRLDTHSSYVDVLWPLLIMSAGLGISAAPSTNAIMMDTPAEKHGVSAAVNDATREIGAAIGIAVAGSILSANYSSRIANAMQYLPEPARGPVRSSLAGALEVAKRAGPSAAPLADYAKTAFWAGVQHSVLALSLISLVGALVLIPLAPGRTRTAACNGPRYAKPLNPHSVRVQDFLDVSGPGDL